MKKILSFLLVTLTVITALPLSAFASSAELKLDVPRTVTVPEGDYAVCTFTPNKSGRYAVYSDNGGNDDIDPVVYIYDSNDNEVKENDDSYYSSSCNFYCVFDAVADETYYFYFDNYCDDESVSYKVAVTKWVKITHQPTKDEPYVALSTDEDYAEYQWYRSEYLEGEVDDTIAKGRTADGNVSVYDPVKGWSPAYVDGTAEANYFRIQLAKGQTISMTVDKGTHLLGIWSNYESKEFEEVAAGEVCEFTAQYTGIYNVYSDGTYGVYVKATTKGDAYKLVEGETDSTLNTKEPGKYICKVDFPGAREEFTDEIEYEQESFFDILYRVFVFVIKLFSKIFSYI